MDINVYLKRVDMLNRKPLSHDDMNLLEVSYRLKKDVCCRFLKRERSKIFMKITTQVSAKALFKLKVELFGVADLVNEEEAIKLSEDPSLLLPMLWPHCSEVIGLLTQRMGLIPIILPL